MRNPIKSFIESPIKLFIYSSIINLLKFLCSKLIETFSVRKENAVKI